MGRETKTGIVLLPRFSEERQPQGTAVRTTTKARRCGRGKLVLIELDRERFLLSQVTETYVNCAVLVFFNLLTGYLHAISREYFRMS